MREAVRNMISNILHLKIINPRWRGFIIRAMQRVNSTPVNQYETEMLKTE